MYLIIVTDRVSKECPKSVCSERITKICPKPHSIEINSNSSHSSEDVVRNSNTNSHAFHPAWDAQSPNNEPPLWKSSMGITRDEMIDLISSFVPTTLYKSSQTYLPIQADPLTWKYTVQFWIARVFERGSSSRRWWMPRRRTGGATEVKSGFNKVNEIGSSYVRLIKRKQQTLPLLISWCLLVIH